MRKLDLCLIACLTLAGCASARHRPASDEKTIEIFTSGSKKPGKPYVEVSRINLYVEKWTGGEPSMADFRPELEARARLSGADAVIDLEWSLKGTAEAGVYHVTGKGIAYSAQAAQDEATASEQGSATPPGAPRAGTERDLQSPALPGRDVELVAGAPARPFTKVSHLDLYVEKKTAGEPSLEEVLPELKRQARLSGADAVMDVEWTLRGTKDAGVYHVTATGLSYSAAAVSPSASQAGPR